ncbi:MAG: tetratricopeptide repeat protein [Planctomycetota bacterium]
MNDVAEGVRHWQCVRTLVRSESEGEEAARFGGIACWQLLNLGWRIGLSAEEAWTLYEEGRGWTGRSGDLRIEFALDVAFAAAQILVAGDPAFASEWMQKAVCAARRSPDPEIRAIARGFDAYSLFLLGRLHEARESCDTVLEATRGHPEYGRDIWGVSSFAFCQHFRATLECRLGDLETANRMLEDAVRTARVHGDKENEGWALSVSGDVAQMSGDPSAAIPLCRRYLEIAEKMGSPFSRIGAYLQQASLACLTGDWDKAAGFSESAIDMLRERRTGLESESLALAELAEARLGAGRLEEALASAEEAVEVARSRHTMIYELHALLALARVLLAVQGGQPPAFGRPWTGPMRSFARAEREITSPSLISNVPSWRARRATPARASAILARRSVASER